MGEAARRKKNGNSAPKKISNEVLQRYLSEIANKNKRAMTALEVEGWGQALSLMFTVYGPDRLHAGITKALAECAFINTIADIETCIPSPIEAGDKAAGAGLTFADPHCAKCEGSGWVKVFEGYTVGGNPIDPKMGAMQRCACFLDRQRLGEPVVKRHRPFTPAEWKEAEIAKRSPKCLAFRNKLREIAGRPPLTTQRHLEDVERGVYQPETEVRQMFSGGRGSGIGAPSSRELAEALAANPHQQLLPEKVRQRG